MGSQIIQRYWKKQFDARCLEIIGIATPAMQRVISLHVGRDFTIDSIFSPVPRLTSNRSSFNSSPALNNDPTNSVKRTYV